MSLFIFFLFFLSLFFSSATQVCHYNKDGDKTEITAAKFGCVSGGEKEKDGEKKNIYNKISCAAEGTNVRSESFTDDKCTVVATGAFVKNSVFTGKDVTDTEMEDSKTVIKVDTTQYIISTCNGGSPGADQQLSGDTTPVCPTTDGSVMPWAATNTDPHGAPCLCGDNKDLNVCGEGSACNSKADAPCVCTPE